MTELVVEFSASAYLTDTQLSRLKRIPTNELVGRLDPTTAQWIAPSTERSVGGSAPVLIKIVPAIGNRFFGLVGLRLHPFQAPQDQAHFPQVESGHSRFDPL